jgi:hypothetical protein
MQEIFFLARHIPFWAVPFIVMGGEFGYLFWLKKKKAMASFCFSLVLVGMVANAFYFWAGGPEKTVSFIKKMHRNYQ